MFCIERSQPQTAHFTVHAMYSCRLTLLYMSTGWTGNQNLFGWLTRWNLVDMWISTKFWSTYRTHQEQTFQKSPQHRAQCNTSKTTETQEHFLEITSSTVCLCHDSCPRSKWCFSRRLSSDCRRRSKRMYTVMHPEAMLSAGLDQWELPNNGLYFKKLNVCLLRTSRSYVWEPAFQVKSVPIKCNWLKSTDGSLQLTISNVHGQHACRWEWTGLQQWDRFSRTVY